MGRTRVLLLSLGAPLLLLTALLRLAPGNAASRPAATAPLAADNLQLTAHSGAAVGGVAVSGTTALVGAGPSLNLVDVANATAPQRLNQLVLPSRVGEILWTGALAFVATANDGVYLVDMSGAPALSIVARYAGTATARGLARLGSQLLVTAVEGLQVVDLSTPEAPQLQLTLPAGGGPRRVATFANGALVTADDGSITRLDFSIPATPTVTAATAVPGAAWGVAVSGGYGYVAWSDCSSGCSARLRVVDLQAPDLAAVADRGLGAAVARGVAVAGGYAYVSRSSFSGPYVGPGVTVLDVSQPALPIVVADYQVPGAYGAGDLAVSGPRAYIAQGGSGLQIAAISDPTAPQTLGAWTAPGRAHAAALSGAQLLVAAGDGATRGELWLLDPLTLMPTATLWLPALTDAWLVTAAGDYAYVAGPAAGGGHALRIVDLAGANAPLDVAGLPLTDPQHLTTHGDYVFAQEGDALTIIDVSAPLTPTVAGAYPVGGALTVSGTLGLLATGDGGLRLLDMTVPAVPQPLGGPIGSFAAYDLVRRGSLLYVAAGAQGVQVVDVSSPQAPAVVGGFDPAWPVDRLAGGADYLFAAAGADGVYALTLADPLAPAISGSFAGGSQVATGVIADGLRSWSLAGGYGVYGLVHRFAVTGEVRQANGLPWRGATLALDGGLSDDSDAAGVYAIAEIPAGSYWLTPQHGGYVFTPTERAVTLPPTLSEQDFVVLPPPVTVTLTPGTATHLLITDTQGVTTTLSIPAGAVTQTHKLTVTPLAVADEPGYPFAGHGLALALINAAPDAPFAIPVTLTIAYTNADVAGIVAAELALWTRSGAGWETVSTGCAAALPAVDTVLQRVTVRICRSGVYALFGPQRRIYLPIIVLR